MSSQAWVQPTITAIATLSGAALGSAGTYLAQRGVWNRQYAARWDEARRIAYSNLLSVCNRWHEAIYLKDEERANALANEAVQLTGEASLLANDRTRAAARDLLNYNWAYQRKTIGNGGSEAPDEFEHYQQMRDIFRDAARMEIKIT
jgi:hypothetical protein